MVSFWWSNIQYTSCFFSWVFCFVLLFKSCILWSVQTVVGMLSVSWVCIWWPYPLPLPYRHGSIYVLLMRHLFLYLLKDDSLIPVGAQICHTDLAAWNPKPLFLGNDWDNYRSIFVEVHLHYILCVRGLLCLWIVGFSSSTRRVLSIPFFFFFWLRFSYLVCISWVYFYLQIYFF